eukprot:tig00021582_g22622.t1
MSCFAAPVTPLRPPAQAANGWRALPASQLCTSMPTPRARTAGRTPAPAAVDVTCSSRQPPRAAFEASEPSAKPASRRALLSALALAAAAAAARPDAARAANKVDWDAAEFTATKSGLLVKDDVEGEGPSPRRNMIVTSIEGLDFEEQRNARPCATARVRGVRVVLDGCPARPRFVACRGERGEELARAIEAKINAVMWRYRWTARFPGLHSP